MPDLVLEKGGQIYRFKLHEDKSVTNGKSIYIPFNGRDYYARYGDTPTPLITEINNKKYFIQYEPVEFVSYSWGRNGRDNGLYNENVFLPKGQYRITYTHKKRNNRSESETSSETFIMNTSQEARMEIEYNQQANIHKMWVTIPYVYSGYQEHLYGDITFTIERIGD